MMAVGGRGRAFAHDEIEGGDFVAQLALAALGDLRTDARNGVNTIDIFLSNRVNQIFGRQHRQNRERELRSDVLHAQQQIERVLFRRRRKTVEGDRILTHDLTNLELDRRTRRRRAVIGRERDEDLVADAVGIDDKAAGLAYFDPSGERCDHGLAPGIAFARRARGKAPRMGDGRGILARKIWHNEIASASVASSARSSGTLAPSVRWTISLTWRLS